MEMVLKYEWMHDRSRPDEDGLFALADGQLGYFTARQARASGYRSSMLAYHVAQGRFARAGWGVYRFTRYPHQPHEEVVAAHLEIGDESVVSHETALDLHGLSDVIPDGVHLTIPRRHRYRRAPDGVTLHTTTTPSEPADLVTHPQTGLPVTAPVRTIVDIAVAGTAFEEIAKAAADAIAAGMTTAGELVAAAAARGPMARDLVGRAIEEGAAVRPSTGEPR